MKDTDLPLSSSRTWLLNMTYAEGGFSCIATTKNKASAIARIQEEGALPYRSVRAANKPCQPGP